MVNSASNKPPALDKIAGNWFNLKGEYSRFSLTRGVTGRAYIKVSSSGKGP